MSSSTPSSIPVPATPCLDERPDPDTSNSPDQPVGPPSLANLRSYGDTPSPVPSSMPPPPPPTTSVQAMDVVVSHPSGAGVPSSSVGPYYGDMTGGTSTSSQTQGTIMSYSAAPTMETTYSSPYTGLRRFYQSDLRPGTTCTVSYPQDSGPYDSRFLPQGFPFTPPPPPPPTAPPPAGPPPAVPPPHFDQQSGQSGSSQQQATPSSAAHPLAEDVDDRTFRRHYWDDYRACMAWSRSPPRHWYRDYRDDSSPDWGRPRWHDRYDDGYPRHWDSYRVGRSPFRRSPDYHYRPREPRSPPRRRGPTPSPPPRRRSPYIVSRRSRSSSQSRRSPSDSDRRSRRGRSGDRKYSPSSPTRRTGSSDKAGPTTSGSVEPRPQDQPAPDQSRQRDEVADLLDEINQGLPKPTRGDSAHSGSSRSSSSSDDPPHLSPQRIPGKEETVPSVQAIKDTSSIPMAQFLAAMEKFKAGDTSALQTLLPPDLPADCTNSSDDDTERRSFMNLLSKDPDPNPTEDTPFFRRDTKDKKAFFEAYRKFSSEALELIGQKMVPGKPPRAAAGGKSVSATDQYKPHTLQQSVVQATSEDTEFMRWPVDTGVNDAVNKMVAYYQHGPRPKPDTHPWPPEMKDNLWDKSYKVPRQDLAFQNLPDINKRWLGAQGSNVFVEPATKTQCAEIEDRHLTGHTTWMETLSARATHFSALAAKLTHCAWNRSEQLAKEGKTPDDRLLRELHFEAHMLSEEAMVLTSQLFTHVHMARRK